jgi:hypothetical protein
MTTNFNPSAKNEDVLFLSDDDFGNESLIYFEISSEEFKKNNDFILDKVNPLYWEETDEFGIYE